MKPNFINEFNGHVTRIITHPNSTKSDLLTFIALFYIWNKSFWKRSLTVFNEDFQSKSKLDPRTFNESFKRLEKWGIIQIIGRGEKNCKIIQIIRISESDNNVTPIQNGNGTDTKMPGSPDKNVPVSDTKVSDNINNENSFKPSKEDIKTHPEASLFDLKENSVYQHN